jgi:hypothetical protein
MGAYGGPEGPHMEPIEVISGDLGVGISGSRGPEVVIDPVWTRYGPVMDPLQHPILHVSGNISI